MKVDATSGRLQAGDKRPEVASTLDWSLLKRVSRSFYLTLRLLPGPVRESIALAYLLARLSDTEADGAVSEAERELLDRRAELEQMLAASPDREEIEKVWMTIQEGQRFDAERFGRGASPLKSRIVGDNDPYPVLSKEELDRYTYLVAGCVGEFWTGICAKRLPGFSRRPREEMATLGVNFGKGLQLVNILRDRAADAGLGRVYVAVQDRAETLGLARQHLQDAECYVRALTQRRLRAACALPLLLARETLDLVEWHPETERVKVSRTRVWMLFLRALVF